MVSRLNFIFFFLFFTGSVFAYEWLPHGPQGVKITNICFVNNATGVLCTETGIYLYQDDMEWHFYESGLPVVEATWYTQEKLLVILGDGSYSDGVYTFDIQTGDFEVVDWFFRPSFLRYYALTDVYFLGQQEGGLNLSMDGEIWYNIGLFDNKPCLDIAFYESQVVVALGEDEDRLLLSSDAGNSWTTPLNAGEFYEVEFNGNGVLFAIAPFMAASSGIYKSDDFGLNWDPFIWEWQMNALACDPFGYVLVGWDDLLGIARVDPSIWDPGFVFLNNGLPDTGVHTIKINPVMSAPNVFVCTDSGVFFSHDYLTDVPGIEDQTGFEIFPSPVRSGQAVSCRVPKKAIGRSILIFDAAGNQMRTHKCNGEYQNIPTHGLQAGVYYLQLQDGNREHIGKLLVL